MPKCVQRHAADAGIVDTSPSAGSGNGIRLPLPFFCEERLIASVECVSIHPFPRCSITVVHRAFVETRVGDGTGLPRC
jgi:hypothetical protein